MNNQIDNLMYQAGLTAQGCWDEMDDYDRAAIQRFAKLIILHCANHVDNAVSVDGRALIKHFGIEE